MLGWIKRSVSRFEEEQRRFHEFLLEVDSGTRKLPFFPRVGLYLVRVIYYACKGFWFDDGFSKAAALAYSLLCSTVPIAVLILYALLNEKLGSLHDYAEKAAKYLQEILVPTKADQMVTYLKELQQKLAHARNPLGIAGFGFLLLIAYSLLNMLEGVMNAVWKVKDPPLRFGRIPVFLLILSAGTATLGVTRMIHFPPLISAFLNFALPWIVLWIVFFLIFFLVPNTRVAFFPAVAISALCAGAFFLMKTGFNFYLEHFLTYEKIFGAIGLIPVFLLWIYLTGCLLIFGGELTYVIQHFKAVADRKFRIVVNSRFFPEYLAIRILLALGRAQGKPVSISRLCNEIPVPETEIKDGLHRLASVKIVKKKLLKGYVLNQPPDTIRLRNLLHLGKHALEQLKLVGDETGAGRFCISLIERIVKNASSVPGDITLADALAQIKEENKPENDQVE